jgi:hypothetical protein
MDWDDGWNWETKPWKGGWKILSGADVCKLFSVRFSCHFPLGFYGYPCTSARGAQSGPTGALFGLSSTNIGWLERYKRLVSLHSGWSTLNYPHFYLTTCSFKILFKRYLGCLYNHKSPACQASQLDAGAWIGSSLRPRVVKTESKTEEEIVLDPLRRSQN